VKLYCTYLKQAVMHSALLGGEWSYLCLVFRVGFTACLDKAKAKAVPLHATDMLGGRGGIAPTHSRPRH
jgi:hypothetical protein